MPARATVLPSNVAHFGGLSGLELADTPQHLIAISDRGWAVLLEKQPPHTIRDIQPIGGVPEIRQWQDAESLRRGPDRRLWVSFEGQHRTTLHRPGWAGLIASPVRTVIVPAMRRLASNQGMEALAVLDTGHALAFSETRPNSIALEFGEGRTATTIRTYKTDFPPVDAMALPNGGLLVLVRTPVWPLPPLFATRIDYIAPGWHRSATLAARPLFRLDTALPAANYEGLAVEILTGGVMRLWLVSDDNFILLQDTVLASIDMPEACLDANVVCRMNRVTEPSLPAPAPRSRPNPPSQ